MEKERRMVVRGGRKNARAGANETVSSFLEQETRAEFSTKSTVMRFRSQSV